MSYLDHLYQITPPLNEDTDVLNEIGDTPRGQYALSRVNDINKVRGNMNGWLLAREKINPNIRRHISTEKDISKGIKLANRLKNHGISTAVHDFASNAIQGHKDARNGLLWTTNRVRNQIFGK